MRRSVRIHAGVLASRRPAAGFPFGPQGIGESVKVYMPSGTLVATKTESSLSVIFRYKLTETSVVTAPIATNIPLTETVSPTVTMPTISETVVADLVVIHLLTAAETVAPDPTEPTIIETVTPTLHL